MKRYGIENEYFDWMYDLVCADRFHGDISYWDLLTHLHNIPFRYILPMDENRANNGIELRWRFALHCGFRDVPDALDGPCSVLEMMIALALECEEWMDDTSYGDRTTQWFWGMITNLGLGSMYDSRFDTQYVDNVIDDFLDRKYAPDGRGGLFRIRDCEYDLRDVEIWHQMCWYLGGIT